MKEPEIIAVSVTTPPHHFNISLSKFESYKAFLSK